METLLKIGCYAPVTCSYFQTDAYGHRTAHFWSVLFYIAMMDEVNDEVDDSLEDYAEMIILRSLRGEALPRSANGTNNFYFLREVSDAYAKTTSSVRYADRDIF